MHNDDSRHWAAERLGPGRRAFQTPHNLDVALWRGRDLSDDELRGFRRAYESGHVELDDQGTVLVTRFHTTKRYQLYVTYDGGTVRPGRAWTWSWQEAFTQISFAAELVTDHGWPADHVALEVDRLDVAAGPRPLSAPVLLAEAKLTDTGPGGLQVMLAVFHELAGGSTARVTKGVRDNAVPKYEGLLRLRPAVFVAVAPAARHAFDVTYDAGRAVLTSRAAALGPASIPGGAGQ